MRAPRIYNYFRFRLGSDCDVEELTARTFERAWRARSRYHRDLAGFSTGLFSMRRTSAPTSCACGALPERERELVVLKYGAVINNRLIAKLTA
jgi:hypothetical protein